MRTFVCFAAAAALLVPVSAQAGSGLTAARLRCEYLVSPLAVDARRPRLSWIVTSSERGARQTAYRILVAGSKELLARHRGDLWDTGKVASGETLNIAYAGKPLRSRMQCWWKVRVWDGQGRASAWSAPAFWGVGLLSKSDWKARWIGCAVDRDAADDPAYLPGPMLRRSFGVSSPVKRATVYVTAAGLYELYINGKRVGRDYFTPGWTEYEKRLYYQAYDVTSMVRSGKENVIGAMLGDGWYGLHHRGRGRLALRAQLYIEYGSGRTDLIVTDGRWKVTDRSPLRMSDIYNGETYDATKAVAGWANPGFDDRSWKSPVLDFAGQMGSAWKDVTDTVRALVHENKVSVPVTNERFGDPIYGVVKTLRVSFRTGARVQERRVMEGQTLTLDGGLRPLTIVKAEYGADSNSADVRKAIIEAHPGSPVRVTGVLKPVSVTEPKPGVYVFNLGQNFSGWARLKVKGPRGTTVTLRFAEMLNPDGTIYTTNLRGAKCTDRYTLSGNGTEVWEPRFTFRGFQYVEVTGYPGRPGRDAITGIVLHSDCGITGEWAGSHALLNRLYKNIVWGQRSNYLEVPTDCPQRDERLGWSGDAQVFIGTGAYCMDIAPFFTAWMRTYNDAQYPDGGYPNVAPTGHGVSPAWGDAGVICPWTQYTMYGDRKTLSDHYAGMKRWVEYLRERSTGLLRPAEGYGDWLNVQDDTPRDVIATAFFGHAADLLSRVAGVLGKKDDQARYRKLFQDIGAAFTRAYVTDSSDPKEDGKIKGGSQTAYLLALQFDLLPERVRPRAFERLVEHIEAHGHLTVGFVGVDHLLPVLSRFGRADLAWRLLTTTTYPSWLYSVTQGATTIWERWDGWRHDKGFQNPGMNSFNHYAFGACGKWMFSDAAGIAADGPAFKRIVIRPAVGGGLSWVRAKYRSVRGDIATEWHMADGGLRLRVTVPANATAMVHVPARSAASVSEGGKPASRAPGLRFVGMSGGFAVYEAAAGSYDFRVRGGTTIPSVSPFPSRQGNRP